MNTKKSVGEVLQRFWPLGLIAAIALTFMLTSPKSSQSATTVKTTNYAKVAPKGMATATLSGGCFWSMEAIYKRLKGVQSAEPGYAGGTTKDPTYEQVCTETTGHAETVNIIYDPKVISYGELVTVLLTVLDPTTLNQQGGDVGSSYRSVIFYRTPAEKQIAQDTIKKIGASGMWKDPIVTEVTALKKFYPAEDYHHNYYDTHPDEGYCRAVIVPKLNKLSEHFADRMKK